MDRTRLLAGLCCIITLGMPAAGRAQAPAAQALAEDSPLHNTLALQRAMEQAKQSLHDGNSKKAVEALEEQLARVNGHAAFLQLLRTAYRAHVMDLWVSNQPQAATRYLERLCILEPAAANDATLRPPAPHEQKFTPAPPPPAKNLFAGLPFPNFGLKQKKQDKSTPAPVSPTTTNATTAKAIDLQPAVVRAKVEDPNDDPFSPVHMRPQGLKPETKQALDLLAGAEEEFARKRFSEARVLFEKAYAADKSIVQGSRERWAYCMLNHVVDQLNKPGLDGTDVGLLRQQVNGAVTLAPGLTETGKWLLKEIDGRNGQASGTKTAGPEQSTALEVKHLGKNSSGWQVAETKHFRVFHHQSQDVADKVARIAESTRLAMFRKWFGHDGVKWDPKCELILHGTGADYTRMTGVPAASPGHSRIESDPSGQRIIGRRMDLRCDAAGFLEAVLPHETTHVVLAGMFGKHAVPRWADEGIAVLTEPTPKIQQHRHNLVKGNQDGLLFGVKELMQLQDYPQPRRIGPFYAQSVCLVDFLSEWKGPQAFTAFLSEGLHQSYDAALQKHYGVSMAELEQRWQQHLTGNLAAGKSQASLAP